MRFCPPRNAVGFCVVVRAAVLAGMALGAWRQAVAQTPQQRLTEIIRDTQKQGNRAGRFTLVWWIVPEFWRTALAANGAIPADKIEEMVASIRDINVFAVVDAKMAGFAPEFTSSQELQKDFNVTDSGNELVPLIPEQKQSIATKNMLATMRPMMANMLGEFGKNMLFVVTEGKNKNGSRRIDPTKPGSLVVRLNNEEFHWRLPLGSLLPQKVCPKCNEAFPGNYVFCPFDATPLKERPGVTQ